MMATAQTRVSLEVANVDSAFVATAAASAAIAAALSPPPSRRRAAHPALPWSALPTGSSSSSSATSLSSLSQLYLSPRADDDRQSHFAPPPPPEAAAVFTPVARAPADTETRITQSVVRPPLLGGGGAVLQSATQQQRQRHPQSAASAAATPLLGLQRLRLDAAGRGDIDRVPFASSVSGAKSVGDEILRATDHDEDNDDIYSLSADELAQRIDAGEDAYIRYHQLLAQRCQQSFVRTVNWQLFAMTIHSYSSKCKNNRVEHHPSVV